ncbi:MAG: replication factor C large subunit, partial [Pyrobaculum sp.]
IKNKPRLPPYIKYGFPQRLLLLSKSKEARKRREMLVDYLARNLHMSKSSINIDIVNILSIIVKNNPKVAEKLSKALGISPIEIKNLL